MPLSHQEAAAESSKTNLSVAAARDEGRERCCSMTAPGCCWFGGDNGGCESPSYTSNRPCFCNMHHDILSTVPITSTVWSRNVDHDVIGKRWGRGRGGGCGVFVQRACGAINCASPIVHHHAFKLKVRALPFSRVDLFSRQQVTRMIPGEALCKSLMPEELSFRDRQNCCH